MLANFGSKKPALYENLFIDRDTRYGRGLVLCWLLNEGSGNTVKELVTGRIGALESSPTWVTGHFGRRALQFGSGSNVLLGMNMRPEDTVGTIIAWVYSTSFADYQTILSANASGDSPNYFVMMGIEQTTGKLFFHQIYNDGAVNNLTVANTTAISSSTWTQVAVTTNGSTWKFYVNGTLATSTSQLAGSNTGKWLQYAESRSFAINQTAVNYRIGRRESANVYPFVGIIDHAMVWNRQLSQTDIQTLGSYPFLPISVGSPDNRHYREFIDFSGPRSQTSWFMVQ